VHTRSRTKGAIKHFLQKRWLRIIVIYIPFLFLASSITIVVLYKYFPVTYTPLMALRGFEHRNDNTFRTYKVWKPLDEISPSLAMAAMSSEDIRFVIHRGFDWKSINIARLEHKTGKGLRGASTISQQTAKNVFLLPHRSWVRKGLEAYFTFGIELIWGKKRILEVYLNVIELGSGIYGAEAASQYYYHKPAKLLTQRESALITACFPDPLHRNPTKPTGNMQTRADAIERISSLLPVPDWLLTSDK